MSYNSTLAIRVQLYSTLAIRVQLYSTLAIKSLTTPNKQLISFPLTSKHCTRSQANVWDKFISAIP